MVYNLHLNFHSRLEFSQYFNLSVLVPGYLEAKQFPINKNENTKTEKQKYGSKSHIRSTEMPLCYETFLIHRNTFNQHWEKNYIIIERKIM